MPQKYVLRKCFYKNSPLGIRLKSLPETATGFDEAFDNPYPCWRRISQFLIGMMGFLICYFLSCVLFNTFSIGKISHCHKKTQHIFQKIKTDIFTCPWLNIVTKRIKIWDNCGIGFAFIEPDLNILTLVGLVTIYFAYLVQWLMFECCLNINFTLW